MQKLYRVATLLLVVLVLHLNVVYGVHREGRPSRKDYEHLKPDDKDLEHGSSWDEGGSSADNDVGKCPAKISGQDTVEVDVEQVPSSRGEPQTFEIEVRSNRIGGRREVLRHVRGTKEQLDRFVSLVKHHGGNVCQKIKPWAKGCGYVALGGCGVTAFVLLLYGMAYFGVLLNMLLTWVDKLFGSPITGKDKAASPMEARPGQKFIPGHYEPVHSPFSDFTPGLHLSGAPQPEG